MSLEALMERLIVSLDANTAAHTGKVAPAAAGSAVLGKAHATAPAKPGIDFEKVKAAGVAVKEKLGAAATRKIIETAGKAKALADVKPEHFVALMAAFDAAMAPPASEPDDGDEL